MTERNGIRVWIAPSPYGKPWVFIETPPGGALVSLRDQARLLRAVIKCDALKYGGELTRQTWERYCIMPRSFLWEAGEVDADYPTLRRKYRLPR